MELKADIIIGEDKAQAQAMRIRAACRTWGSTTILGRHSRVRLYALRDSNPSKHPPYSLIKRPLKGGDLLDLGIDRRQLDQQEEGFVPDRLSQRVREE